MWTRWEISEKSEPKSGTQHHRAGQFSLCTLNGISDFSTEFRLDYSVDYWAEEFYDCRGQPMSSRTVTPLG